MSKQLNLRIQGKSDMVEKLSSEIRDFGSFLIFEYLGLDAQDMHGLRRQFRESGSRLRVFKNNILNRALAPMNIPDMAHMSGPNVILLTRNDIRPMQVVAKMCGEKTFLRLKFAFLEGTPISGDRLSLLSTLSSKDDTLALFARTLLFPMYRLLFTLKQLPVGQ